MVSIGWQLKISIDAFRLLNSFSWYFCFFLFGEMKKKKISEQEKAKPVPIEQQQEQNKQLSFALFRKQIKMKIKKKNIQHTFI